MTVEPMDGKVCGYLSMLTMVLQQTNRGGAAARRPVIRIIDIVLSRTAGSFTQPQDPPKHELSECRRRSPSVECAHEPGKEMVVVV